VALSAYSMGPGGGMQQGGFQPGGFQPGGMQQGGYPQGGMQQGGGMQANMAALKQLMAMKEAELAALFESGRPMPQVRRHMRASTSESRQGRQQHGLAGHCVRGSGRAAAHRGRCGVLLRIAASSSLASACCRMCCVPHVC
jgi:hypothetical protein